MSNAKKIRAASNRAWQSREKNGATLMRITLDSCHHAMGESKDWTVLANHLARGLRNGGNREVDNLKLIVRSVLPGAKMVKDDKQPSGIRIILKDVAISNSGVSAVEDLIERNVSITGTAIKTALAPKDDKDTASSFEAKPQDKHDTSAAAWSKKHTDDELQEAIKDAERRLIALRKVAENKAKANAI